MAATARRRQQPANLPLEALKRDLQEFVATSSLSEPDRQWTLDELADALGQTKEAIIDATRETLSEAGYSKRDEVGPVWLADPDFRAILGAKPTLAGMPPPSEIGGRYQGFPVTEMKLSFKQFVVVSEDLAVPMRNVQTRVQLLVDAIVENHQHPFLGGKKVESSEVSYGLRVNLRPISMTLMAVGGLAALEPDEEAEPEEPEEPPAEPEEPGEDPEQESEG